MAIEVGKRVQYLYDSNVPPITGTVTSQGVCDCPDKDMMGGLWSIEWDTAGDPPLWGAYHGENLRVVE